MNIMPNIGDKYEHPTGIYTVMWVCDEIGLSSESFTWTGTIEQLAKEGFKRMSYKPGKEHAKIKEFKLEKAEGDAVSSCNIGWMCPRCGRGNSPTNAVCPCIPLPDGEHY